INNAKIVCQLEQIGSSLDELLWQAVDYKPRVNHFTKPEQVPAKTKTSLELAKKLKKQGFKFLGPTIVYSLMQATGMVNDHLVGCQT
ncbi:MAG: DNA-3-methyladenine glycosylase I, partial [Ligilactobacillus sp.]|nr:DNA-3-methyladenine glycosylase I [Ligilactobacillus sp.]